MTVGSASWALAGSAWKRPQVLSEPCMQLSSCKRVRLLWPWRLLCQLPAVAATDLLYMAADVPLAVLCGTVLLLLYTSFLKK